MAANHKIGLQEDQCPSGVEIRGQQGGSLVPEITLSICATNSHG